MLKQERHKLILAKLREAGRVTSAGLSKSLFVSEDTIRRDLNALNARGLLRKVHGGALAKAISFYSYDENLISHLEEKKIIARKAVSLLSEDQVIIISGGSTNFEFAMAIPHDLNITIYTYSLEIAMIISEKAGPNVIFIGGKLHKKAKVTTGVDVILSLKSIYADLCFLGTSALSISHGLTEINYEVAQVKRAMIDSSKDVISLTTHHKIERSQRFKVCGIERLRTLVTSIEPTQFRLQYPNYDDINLSIV